MVEGRGRPPSVAQGRGERGRGRPTSASRGGGRGRGRPTSASRGGGHGRGRPPGASREGGPGRIKSSSVTRGGGRDRGRTPSAVRGKSLGRGKSPSSTQGGVRSRGRTPNATSGGSRGRGKSPSATRGGGGRGQRRTPSAARGKSRGRGKAPNATRGRGRGQGPLKKTVKKHVPAKSSKSKTSAVMNARNASEKLDRGKRKSAVNSLLVNVARQEEINLQFKTPVASPSPRLNKKVSAKVCEEGQGKKKTCTGSHNSFKKCPYQRLTDFGYEKDTQALLDLPSNIDVVKNSSIAIIAASIRDIVTPNVTISKNDNALVSQESTSDTATQDANISEIDSALVSQVEDAFTNDTTFLKNKNGIPSYITTVPQDNKVPISTAPCALDFRDNGFKKTSRTVSRVQHKELGFKVTHQIQTNTSHNSAVNEDKIEVAKVHNISNKNTTVPILNKNNAAASQVDDIVTAKVFKASTIHRSKKKPYICHTCSKHYFRKDQFLSHITDHTRERLRTVKPKRQHEKKCVTNALSDPVSFVGPSLVKTIIATERNMPENEKDQVETTSEQENVPYGNNVEILYDRTEVGTKDILDAIIDLSDDEDITTPSNSIKGDFITAPTLVATSDALSASPIVNHRINPSFGNKISKVNTVETVTINVSDDEEPIQKCNKKIVGKRQFTYQPLRQNQIPNGGFEKKAEDNPGPINNDLLILNMAKKSGVNSRSICGEALDKIKLLGSAVTLITTTTPCDTSRTEEKAAADMRFKQTEAVKSAKVGSPHKRVTPLSMRETENAVKRLKVCLPLTRSTPSSEETTNTRKRVKIV